PELVEDGVTGLLVAPRDPAALARAVAALLRDPERRARLGAAAARRTATEFDEERLVVVLLDAYDDALARRASPARPAAGPAGPGGAGARGRLAAPRDPAALARAGAALLRDPGRRARLGAAAARRTATEFDEERLVVVLLDAYDDALARRASPARPRA